MIFERAFFSRTITPRPPEPSNGLSIILSCSDSSIVLLTDLTDFLKKEKNIVKQIMRKQTDYIELYTDYLISGNGYATATGLSSMLDGEVSHDQITRFLSKNEFNSKDLWAQVKRTVREVEKDDACLIFDDTVQEKKWTDESDIMCWHFDHTVGKSVRGINMLNALYYSGEASIPVAFEIVEKSIQFSDIKTRQVKRKSDIAKNELMRDMIQTSINNQLKFKYILMDTWFGAKENFEFITKKNKEFIAALKSNRLFATSLENKHAGKFVRVDELELSDGVPLEGIKSLYEAI
ncbi:transposase [uncultured Sulfurimonas sp.]|uniref:transposase n=2 Tax=Sulfurimonas TaxID=202746 RepID=UPI0032B2DDE0